MFHRLQKAARVEAVMSPRAETIPRVLLDASRRFADQIAIETEDGKTTLTYSELAESASGASRGFLALGVAAGDRVAIWAPNIHEWIIAALGLLNVGAVLVPINTRYKAAEAGHVIDTSRARVLCTVGDFLGTDYVALLQDEFGGAGSNADAGSNAGSDSSAVPFAKLPHLEHVIALQGSRAGTRTWEAFLRAGEGVSLDDLIDRIDAVAPDDLSDLLFTSGTTGAPKGVMTTHAQNLQAFTAWTDVVGLEAGDRYLIVNPFFHAFGYKAGWLSCLLRGATILPHATFDPAQVLARIGRDNVSVLPGPPALYQAMLASLDSLGSAQKRPDISSLRLAVTGAAVIPVDLIHRMKDDLGFDTVITGYGLTETCGIVTMCRHDDDPETIATTSGRAIPGVEVAIVDEEFEPLPSGAAGEIVVRGYNIMKGYFEESGRTAEMFHKGWLRTGDIGVMDSRGYLRITDRLKDMFIMGGFNCYPAEIEQLILRHPDVAQVAVIGVPDERMGEVAMAFVVTRRSDVSAAETLSSEALIGWCRAHMANFKVPRYAEIVRELPVNALGKVTKHVLRQRAHEALQLS